MNINKNGGVVFGWFVRLTSITGLITWDIILITYVRFHQGLAHHGIDRDDLPYKAPFQPYASYFGILFINLIILFNGFQVFLSKSWNVDNFITAYVCLPIFLVFYLFWKIIQRPKFVRVSDMDFTTGRRELNESKLCHYYQVYHELSDNVYKVEQEESARYIEPKGIVAKAWDWLSERRGCLFKILDVCSPCFFMQCKTSMRCLQCYFAIPFIIMDHLLSVYITEWVRSLDQHLLMRPRYNIQSPNQSILKQLLGCDGVWPLNHLWTKFG